MMNTDPAVFGVVDYIVFGAMLCASIGIGIYFAFFGDKQKSVEQYLQGNRKLSSIPVAISFVASLISGNLLMIVTSDVYVYGAMPFLSAPTVILVVFLAGYIFIPVYFNCGALNAYQYLELRFDWKVRKMASLIFVFNSYASTPLISYAPSLAFSQVTGHDVHAINAIVIGVCVFYTMLGGIKAVIWTDVVQAAIMLISGIAIVVCGVINLGGLDVVLDRAETGGRLVLFDFSPSFTTRQTFWNLVSGNIIVWTGLLAFHQTSVQRILALKSAAQARRTTFGFGVGYFIIISLAVFTGVVIYATYYNCDPLTTKQVSKTDKIFAHFVMHSIGHWKGMPGLFIAAMFSASLSTVSASLNSLAGIVYQDYFQKCKIFRHTDARASFFMKCIVFLSGIYCILAGLFIHNLANITQITSSIAGVFLGVASGVFILGMLIPWCNKHGALYGAIISIAFILWIALRATFEQRNGNLLHPTLPLSVDGCELGNITTAANATLKSILQNVPQQEPFILYKISFFFYPLLTVLTVLVSGIIISLLTGATKPGELRPNVLASCVYWMLPQFKETREKRQDSRQYRAEEFDQEKQIPLTALQNDID